MARETEELFCTGCNFFGQLGLGYQSRPSPAYIPCKFNDNRIQSHEITDIQCGTQFTVVVKKNGEIHFCGTLNGAVFPTLTLIDIPLPLSCTKISCGRKHILALMSSGYVFSWGTGYLGQLGLGDDSSWDTPRMIRSLDPKRLNDTVKSVVCGGSHSGVLTSKGSIYMWGLNRNGQTGTGLKVESVLEPRPIDLTDIGRKQPKSLVCGRNHTLLLTNDGRILSWGAGGSGRLGLTEFRKNLYTPLEIQFFRSRPAQEVTCGDFHNLALGIDGFIYTWGYNLEGQCGNGGTMNQKTPKKIEFPFDLTLNGSENGNSGSRASASFPSSSSTSSGSNHQNNPTIKQISCGSSWSSVLTHSGVLYSWGYGDGGWLGIEPIQNLPYIESEIPPPSQTGDVNSYYATTYSRSFDSNVNLLRPLPVEYFIQNNYRIKWIRNGGGHTIYCVDYDEEIRNSFTSQLEVMRNYLNSDERTDDKDEESQEKRRQGDKDSKYSIKESANFSQIEGERRGELASQIISGQFGYSTHGSATNTSGTSDATSRSTSSGTTLTTFMSWIRHNKVPEVHHALSNSHVNVFQTDENGNTSLHIACQNGHLNISKILLDYSEQTEPPPPSPSASASASLSSPSPSSPPLSPHQRGDQNMRRLLFLNSQNKRGNTALHYTIAYGYHEISEYLINYGANEYIVNEEGLTCYEGLKREDLEKI